MLCFEDVFAARALLHEAPERREALLSALDILQADPNAVGLLQHLLDTRALDPERVEELRDAAAEDMRLRSMRHYTNLLTQTGMDPMTLELIEERVGARDPKSLGEGLIKARLIKAEKEEELRFFARLLYDRDLAQAVRDVTATLEEAAPALEASATHSEAVELPPLPPSEPRQHVTQVISTHDLRQTLVAEEVSGDDLVPPQFPIPEWVDTADPRTGQHIGDYRILGRVGGGSMGLVYLADHPNEPRRPVALKVLRHEATSEARGRFKTEILASSFFSHPGVIDVYDAGETEERLPFLAMEFFDGEDLAEILKVQRRVPPTRALRIFAEMLSALGAAHSAGVIHRDVKPSNILVSADGEQTKLMDFGISEILNPGDFEEQLYSTQEGTLVGTPMYLAPEQAFGQAQLTPAADLYSAGLVLYEMLSGRLPFYAENAWGYVSAHMNEPPLPLSEAAPFTATLPSALHDLLAELLCKSPDDRPPSAEAVIKRVEELRALLTAPEPPTSRRGLFWKRRG